MAAQVLRAITATPTERIGDCWRRSVLDLHDTLDARYLQGLGGSKLAALPPYTGGRATTA